MRVNSRGYRSLTPIFSEPPMTDFVSPPQAVPPAVFEPTPPAPPPGPRVERLRFSGTAGEYFGIWIVNLFLTVITLGIYSAWAKVRKKRYFYGNTWLVDSNFEYHGNPVAILKGRIIAFVAFAIPSCYCPSAARSSRNASWSTP